MTATDAYSKARDQLVHELQFLDALIEHKPFPNFPISETVRLWAEAERQCWLALHERAAEYLRIAESLRDEQRNEELPAPLRFSRAAAER
jgi:hypothetical protein